MREGWTTARIADVANVVNGGTPKTKVPEFWGGPHLWITPAEMGNRATPYLAESRRTLTDSGLQRSSASLVPPNSVILSTRAPIGHLVINTEPMAFNQGCRGLVPGENLNDKYLYYFLSANTILLNDLGSGTTFKELAAGKLKNVQLPIPPLEEQKRIVAILDEAFASIETAIANTEKNLANARELFESYADLAVRGLQGAHCCLKDCVEQVSTGPFGSLLHKSDYVSDGLPLVNPINIVDSRIVPDDRKCVAEDTLERLSAYVLKEGDVVVARRGEIGRCAVVEQGQDGWLCGTGCFFVRPAKELNPHFLVNLLRSEIGRSELLRRSTGATMKNLGNKALSTFEIRLPPREAQDKAIEQLSDLQNASHELTQVFRRKLGSLQELKQSLLQKAFSGELTADRVGEELESATA